MQQVPIIALIILFNWRCPFLPLFSLRRPSFSLAFFPRSTPPRFGFSVVGFFSRFHSFLQRQKKKKKRGGGGGVIYHSFVRVYVLILKEEEHGEFPRRRLRGGLMYILEDRE